MTKIKGFYYSGQVSKKEEVHLSVSLEKIFLTATATTANNDTPLKTYTLEEATVIPPLGKTACCLDFNDGARFETSEVEAFNQIFAHKKTSRFIHSLESHTALALSVLASLVLLLIFSYFYLIPLGGAYIAHKTPHKILQLVEDGTLSTLKRVWRIELKKIDPKKHPEFEKIFKKIEQDHSKLHVNVQVTSSSFLGANAFALPAGKIVVTQDLLQLVSENELYAILLHEVGHVSQRHGMKAIVQNAGLLMVFSLAIGVADFSSIPLTLLGANYSRNDEYEADKYSAQALLKEDLSPLLLAQGLRKIEKKSKNKDEEKDSNDRLNIFSTHPLTQKREKRLEGFAQGL